MSSNFTSLRNSRSSLISKLSNELKKASSSKGADERFWKLSVDAKTGIGYAKIRFLPAPKNEDIPWARIWSHGFAGPSGSWFIENCPTTLDGRPCPACKDNNRLWNSGIESDKDIARAHKRKLSFISNILVLEDSAHPENVGKVFLFKYGKKIHDKITELLEPQFPDQQPANPFDMWEGCDFKLKAQKVGGFQNYDKSEFGDPSELFPGKDADKEALWDKEYSLQEFLGEDQFKSFDELQSLLNRALDASAGRAETAGEAIEREASLPTPAPEPAQRVAKPARKPVAAPKPAPVSVAEDEDEVNEFFAGVLNDEN